MIGVNRPRKQKRDGQIRFRGHLGLMPLGLRIERVCGGELGSL